MYRPFGCVPFAALACAGLKRQNAKSGSPGDALRLNMDARRERHPGGEGDPTAAGTAFAVNSDA